MMPDPPVFGSLATYKAALADLTLWRPIVEAVLARHGLGEAVGPLTPGNNPTYPTFLTPTVVVKFFGGFTDWRAGSAAERIALTHLTQAPDLGAPDLGAPTLLAQGTVAPDRESPWPYVIMARLSGVTVSRAGLSRPQWLNLAADLGDRVKRLHRLPLPQATPPSWSPVPMAEAAARSSLPPHLAEQAAEFVNRYEPADPVLVHQDIVANHLYVSNGRLSGIIDWGDAIVADRHIELIQIQRDLFDCDKDLLRVFLAASAWPTTPDFPARALAFGLRRQAIGLAQHHSIDVFQPIAAKFPLDQVPDLDALAMLVFGV